MTRLLKLWIAVAAFAIAALLTLGAGLLASMTLRVAFADHEKWWWPLAVTGTVLMVTVLPIGGVWYLRRIGRGPQRQQPSRGPILNVP